MPSRKQFIQSHGAECANWTWSWSFVNHENKFIIFGLWEEFIPAELGLILEESWQIGPNGKRQPGYAQAVQHIGLITNEGCQLFTFPIFKDEADPSSAELKPSVIARFDPKLSQKSLIVLGDKWYAGSVDRDRHYPEEIDPRRRYREGAAKQVVINAYERNGDAREACLAHYKYSCQVCKFDFEKFYGSVGSEYIHVHHRAPLAEVGREYEIDPIKDLVPVCPNCHAMDS